MLSYGMNRDSNNPRNTKDQAHCIQRTILVVVSIPFPFSCACPFASPLAWPFTFPLHVDSCDDDICPFCIATLPHEILFK
jgi:hypothetical protein